MTRRSQIGGALTGAILFGVALFCVYLLLRGFWTLGVSLLDWARYGDWRHPNIAAELSAFGIRSPHLKWIGLDRILQWLLALPGSVGLFLAAWGIGTIAHRVSEELERPRVTSGE